jgi:NMD protein affecting ribosome stability and mRNA decay
MASQKKKRSRAAVRRPVKDPRVTRSQKGPRIAAKVKPPKDPTVCDGCGSVYTRKQWRSGTLRSTRALLDTASWGRCPACEQVGRGEGYGRVLISGAFVAENVDRIERRIRNVAARAQWTQTQRRLVSCDRIDSGLEVITTSQKLAHRLVREMEKAFGGTTRFVWASDDGSLFATWKSP